MFFFSWQTNCENEKKEPVDPHLKKNVELIRLGVFFGIFSRSATGVQSSEQTVKPQSAGSFQPWNMIYGYHVYHIYH
jgi:hypothetical protein